MEDHVNRTEAPPQAAFILHSPAVDFIENRLPRYHPAFNTHHVQFDPSRTQFVPREPSQIHQSLVPRSTPSSIVAVPGVPSSPQQLPRSAPGIISEMPFWHEIFPKAMGILETELVPISNADSEWGIRQLSTWVDVQARLDVARQKYDFKHGMQHVGKFRSWLRGGLDNHATTLQQGAKLIPEVDISKPIVGAIRLVLDAYRQASEVRQEVETSFDDLPDMFEKMDFYLRTYPKDQNIVKVSEYLVGYIFVAIENAVAFYTSHQGKFPALVSNTAFFDATAKRAVLALQSGSQYQKSLLKSLSDVKSCCEKLESQASMSLAHRVTTDNSHIMNQNSSILQESSLTQHILGSIYQHVQFSNIGMMFYADLLNKVLPLLTDLQRARQSHSPPMMRTPSPLPQIVETQPIWVSQDILSRLQIPDIDQSDLHHIAARTEHLLHEDRGRTQQILGTRLFRDWLTCNGSARLLVHGNFRPPYDISPLSVVCTLLTHTFRSSMDGLVGLVFFCGRHLVWDEHQGGLAMIRSLIAQVLHQFSFTGIEPLPNTCLQDLERDDVNVLCEVFSLLIRQLPPTILVICLIDGISLYETEEYLNGMDVVVMYLIDLVEYGTRMGRPPFKLLITSPQPTLEVRKVFDSKPDTLLHMHNVPVVGEGADTIHVMEQLALDMRPGLK